MKTSTLLFCGEEGFEPPVSCPTLVFKTSAFDHSAISPFFKDPAKIVYFLLAKSIYIFFSENKKGLMKTLTLLPCGERGIRTPGELPHAGFQDQCIRPLCHFSFLQRPCKDSTLYFYFPNKFNLKFNSNYKHLKTNKLTAKII